MACVPDCYSTYLRNKINDMLFRGVPYAPPSTLYFALFTVAPTAAAGSGTEVTGGSYARVAFASNSSDWTASSGGITQNLMAIAWPVPTASWGVVVSAAAFDASSGGNMIIFLPGPGFQPAIVTAVGVPPTIDVAGWSNGWAA